MIYNELISSNNINSLTAFCITCQVPKPKIGYCWPLLNFIIFTDVEDDMSSVIYNQC